MAFSSPYVYPPRDPASHTHTAIILHRRRGNGPDFEKAFFSGKTSSSPPRNLPDAFPTWRWVFPSARKLWNSAFNEELPAWFDGYSLTDTNERQELQVGGLEESLEYVLSVIDEEVRVLGGRTDRIVIGGMSQGMAMALWTLLRGVGRVGATEMRCGGPFAGAFGVCGWLPFSNEIKKSVEAIDGANPDNVRQSERHGREEAAANVLSVVDAIPDRFGDDKTNSAGISDACNTSPSKALDRAEQAKSLVSTPIFLCHGRDDACVDIGLGEEAAQLLIQTGAEVEWRTHTVGTANESDAHWIAEPEGFDDLVCFLEKCALAATE